VLLLLLVILLLLFGPGSRITSRSRSFYILLASFRLPLHNVD
jgi:hypothetical protein